MDKLLHEKDKSQPLLHRRIDFIPAKKKENGFNPKFNATDKKIENGESNSLETYSSQLELYPQRKVVGALEWNRIGKIGNGLNNIGFTSYLNALVQCLCYIPPFSQLLLTDELLTRASMQENGGKYCPLVCLKDTFEQLFQAGNGTDTPHKLISLLPYIAPKLQSGTENDPNGLFRAILKYSVKSCLTAAGIKKSNSKETTFIHQLFSVAIDRTDKCTQKDCNTPIVNSFKQFGFIIPAKYLGKYEVEKSIRKVLSSMSMNKLNKADCSACKTPIDVSSSNPDYALSTYPSVLAITYQNENNPDVSPKARKVKKVDVIQPTIEFVHNSSKVQYRLCSVLVHKGNELSTGKYGAFVKNSNGIWYELFDESNRQMKLDTVLKETPYMLFYCIVHKKENSKKSSKQKSKQKQQEPIPSPKEEIGKKLKRESTVKAEGSSLSSKHDTPKSEIASFASKWNDAKQNSVSPGKQVYESLNSSLFGSFLEDVSVRTDDTAERANASFRTPIAAKKSNFNQTESVKIHKSSAKTSKAWKEHVKSARKGENSIALESWEQEESKSTVSLVKKDKKRKRARYDAWDKALDQGKVKKVKKAKKKSAKGKSNKFQKRFEEKQKEKEK